MTGQTDLEQLLAQLSPVLREPIYVFCTLPKGRLENSIDLEPLASFQELEGLTLILRQDKADQAGLKYEGVFRCITLSVHSSLTAVGLTAAVSSALTKEGISANIVAAYFHDHVFVPSMKAKDALCVLGALQSSSVDEACSFQSI